MERTISNMSFITSGGAGLWGLLTFTEWMMVGGLVIALLNAGINWIYREKHNRLEERRLKQKTLSDKGRADEDRRDDDTF